MALLTNSLTIPSATCRYLRRRLPYSRPRNEVRICCSNYYPPNKFKRAYTSVMIVPTGIGASIGGFAGDALPVARALTSVVDCLISHPNVLNAAMLYWPMPNVLYVEGFALDRFAEGLWALKPVHQNKVGLVLDAAIEDELRIRHLQVVDATRASLGLPVVKYVVTDAPLQVEKWVDPKTGQSTGRIKGSDSLLRAVQTLINRSSVNAVAVVARFPDDDVQDVDDYRQGMGIDDLAGVEAIISHLVVKEFQIPCAHAPALSPLPLSMSLCPKSAAEEIGYTFLPCVLAGLSNAPQYVVKSSGSLEMGCMLASDVDSVILPADACGGDGVLAFASNEQNKPLIITVEENETVLHDTPDKLGIEAEKKLKPDRKSFSYRKYTMSESVPEHVFVRFFAQRYSTHVSLAIHAQLLVNGDGNSLNEVKVSNYWEAIGVIAAHKAGIDPNSLRRNRISNIRRTPAIPFNGHAVSSARYSVD